MEYFRIVRSGWPSACVLALACVMNSGCAKVYHAVHYNPLSLAMHDHAKNYYHSEDTGRIIAKDRCFIPEEPPCYGYEPTCWTRWPADCPKCPVDCECEQEVVISDHVVGGAHDSIIADQGQPHEAAAPVETEAAGDAHSDDASVQPEALEPDYEEGATLAPVISAEDLPQYQSSALPVKKEEPTAPWLPGSVGANVDVAEEAIVPLEQPRSIAEPRVEAEEQLTQPETQLPEPSEPIERRSSRRRRTFAKSQTIESATPAAAGEIDDRTASFDMLATAGPIATQESVAAASTIPSFRIQARTDTALVASKADTDSDVKLSRRPKSKVTTVSFR